MWRDGAKNRGKELSAHAEFAIETGTKVYFADPHSPWQRPTSENTNGLLRQYFPKGTDLSRWSREDLAYAIFSFVEGFYNPRRRHSTLGYFSPADYETQHALRTTAGPHTEPLHDQNHPTPVVRGSGGTSGRSGLTLPLAR